MPRAHHILARVAALAAVWSAPSCTDAGELLGVVATADARIPTTVDVVWDLFSPAGETWVEYGAAPDALDRYTPHGTGPSATILGLVGGQTTWLRAVTLDGAGQRWESVATEIAVAGPPDALPIFTIDDVDEAVIDPGSVVLLTLLRQDSSWLVGLDREGNYVWWLESEDGVDVPSLHLSADGRGLVFLHQELLGEGEDNGVRLASFDGKTYDLVLVDDAHHDAIQLPDGAIVSIVSTDEPNAELEDGTTEHLAIDVIRESPSGALFPEDTRTLFSFLDDYGHAPWPMCTHFDEAGPGGGKDYVHANSLSFDVDNDAVLVMSKNLDALVSVDRATGDITWQAGGRYADLSSTDPWSHGHMSHAWSDGFVVFDNGYHHSTKASRAVEYHLDHADGTIEPVWSFSSESGTLSPLLGDVRKLDHTYMISWTVEGMLTEVDTAGTVVWRASAELGSATGRVLVLPDLYP